MSGLGMSVCSFCNRLCYGINNIPEYVCATCEAGVEPAEWVSGWKQSSQTVMKPYIRAQQAKRRKFPQCHLCSRHLDQDREFCTSHAPLIQEWIDTLGHRAAVLWLQRKHSMSWVLRQLRDFQDRKRLTAGLFPPKI